MKARRRRLKRNREAQSREQPTSNVELVQIPQESAGEIWPLAAPFIEAAAERGEYSAEDLRQSVIGGNGQLWLAWSDHCEAAAITKIIDAREGTICLLAACGGKDMDRWLGLLAGIEEWAKAQACKLVRIYARKGWARKLKDYKMERVILDKVLT